MEGFSAFVGSRYPALVRYGVLLTGDRGHGEDLVQTALVKTFRVWGRLYPDGQPEAYTRTVMERLAWRMVRRRWRGELPTADLPELAADTDAYAIKDQAEAVLDALRTLPAQQRIVLVLRYWAGLSEAEIAERLGCSAGTVKSRASRAVAFLRASKLLNDMDADVDETIGERR
ncbi:MAG: SigE family RNA polymerase sigma factor [Geodermatophilaceae bacterium]|nr:SigE family RNA polymerase sigma factor [Geodermatophilaceae bacterium]